MILAELVIEDYKQFAGRHHIVPPAAGTVAIIGPNGAGKTTLFEAIEWCLYNPREIEADEVQSRGRAARPRVKVVLQDPRQDARYVVERTLKRGVATAIVYRDQGDEASSSPIVQGSRQVTEYVARHLIGLSHRAFVSTFFTRQKELTFFGNLKETDRRREVGRLLGMETIREAQKLIADDRNAARSEASSLALQFREASAGRDFAAETAEADRLVAERAASVAEAQTRLAAATEAHRLAREQMTSLQDLERRDAALRRELERVAGDARTAAARRAAAAAEIARLDEAAASRAALEPVAATEPALRAEVGAHEAQRDRHKQVEQLSAEMSRADHGLVAVARDLQRAVAGAKAPAVAGWAWLPDDAADPAGAARRLIAVAESQDAVAAAEHAAALAACLRLVEIRSDAESKRIKFEQQLDMLERDLQAGLAEGNPAEAAAGAQQAREAAVRAAQQALTNAANARETIAQLEPIVASLRSQRFEDRCPTCGRPFAAHEAGITLAALEDRVDELGRLIALREEERRQAEQRATASEHVQQRAVERIAALNTLQGRIAQGRPMVAEARQTHQQAIRNCAEAVAGYGLDGEPTRPIVDEAQAHADMLRRVVATVQLLRTLCASADGQLAERRAAAQTLAALGPVVYDAAVHDAARIALTRAQEAAARIIQIDQDLTRRAAAEADRATTTADLARLETERSGLVTELAAVGFDPVALAAAVVAEQTTLVEERAALETRGAAEAAHRETEGARQRLLADHAHIARLAARSDARARDADQLDSMYREFTLFEQYVARRITPQLAEHTSELLTAITEGKYDRVAFDENYGIEVYDGADERFSVEAFSGGERDVIALCARLALSRLVGGQAHNPPGFLVLDEVFGSLDRERRAQVLAILGALAGTADAFHQLFIISHVDDVRASPIFDEVWRVTETDDGVSHVENLTATGSIEDV